MLPGLRIATLFDDGHSVIDSDLYIADLKLKKKIQLTNTPKLLEMRPSWSPDGQKISFDSDGAIYSAKVFDLR